MIIGICGKSGSGKTTLAKNISDNTKKEVIHLDIDKIGHIVLTFENVKEKIVEKFGKQVVEQGIVNRKKISNITFNSKEKMEELIDATWPEMQEVINSKLEKSEEKIIILDWQLLQKTQYFNMCDITILLDIPYELRKQRTIVRDNISEEQFDLREKASYTYKKDEFDIIIEDLNEENIRKVISKICL